MQMVKINSKVKEETLKALKIEAEKDGRTESGMIRFILEKYFHGGFADGKPVIRDTTIKTASKDMTAFFNERNKNVLKIGDSTIYDSDDVKQCNH